MMRVEPPGLCLSHHCGVTVRRIMGTVAATVKKDLGATHEFLV
jgi:hypothetical protein